jgi:hypothetical protein
MKSTPTVNREEELAVFTELLKLAELGKSAALVVEADSGRGKTRLLQRFQELCEKRAAWSYVDLVGGSLTPLDILSRVTADLSIALDRCTSVLNKRGVISVPPVQIENNRTYGWATFNVTATIQVAGLSQNEQKQVWNDAAQAFQQDLRKYGQSANARAVVVLFDTFEKAAPDSQAWIADHMLPAVAHNRVPGLLIVVAGRVCPKVSGEWDAECESLSLPLLKEEHWAEYAERVGSTLTTSQVQQLYRKHEGATLKMAETVSLFVPP